MMLAREEASCPILRRKITATLPLKRPLASNCRRRLRAVFGRDYPLTRDHSGTGESCISQEIAASFSPRLPITSRGAWRL